ncbi:MAG TPA: hypothetical protein VG457_04650 [Planctomycetota bacterium]|jgi:hypothetical protein|nr:hypothetical protein [Planctomycetota bacterium]
MRTAIPPEGMGGPVSPGPEDAGIRERLEAILPDEERILWVGQPDLTRATRQGVITSLVGILLLALFAGLEGGISGCAAFDRLSSGFVPRDGGGSGFFGVLDSLFFVVFGVFLLGAPFLSRQAARKTLYAVTPRRLLIVRLERSPVAQSYLLPRLPLLEGREHPDGTGDLIFSSRTESSGDGGPTVVEIGFLGIRNVRKVEKLVRSLLASARRPE